MRTRKFLCANAGTESLLLRLLHYKKYDEAELLLSGGKKGFGLIETLITNEMRRRNKCRLQIF